MKRAHAKAALLRLSPESLRDWKVSVRRAYGQTAAVMEGADVDRLEVRRGRYSLVVICIVVDILRP